MRTKNKKKTLFYIKIDLNFLRFHIDKIENRKRILIQKFRIRDFRFEIKKCNATMKTSKKIHDFAFKLFCFFANISLILIYLIYKIYLLHSIRIQKFEIRALYRKNKFIRHFK